MLNITGNVYPVSPGSVDLVIRTSTGDVFFSSTVSLDGSGEFNAGQLVYPGDEVGTYTVSVHFLGVINTTSLVIISGGYIASELGHFFSSICVPITIIGRNPKLVPQEESEISSLLKMKMSESMKILSNNEPISIKMKNGEKLVVTRDLATGRTENIACQEILVAAGVKPNTDLLNPEKSSVDVSSGGWIKVNEYLETSKKNIWALGDIIGRNLYRHTANYEADIVIKNALYNEKIFVDKHAVPHAVFTHPQIGGVGLTEAKAILNHKILVGIGKYVDTAKGYAMAENDGFVKVIVDAENYKILGAHIIGPEASILVQQIVYLMNVGD